MPAIGIRKTGREGWFGSRKVSWLSPRSALITHCAWALRIGQYGSTVTSTGLRPVVTVASMIGRIVAAKPPPATLSVRRDTVSEPEFATHTETPLSKARPFGFLKPVMFACRPFGTFQYSATEPFSSPPPPRPRVNAT